MFIVCLNMLDQAQNSFRPQMRGRLNHPRTETPCECLIISLLIHVCAVLATPTCLRQHLQIVLSQDDRAHNTQYKSIINGGISFSIQYINIYMFRYDTLYTVYMSYMFFCWFCEFYILHAPLWPLSTYIELCQLNLPRCPMYGIMEYLPFRTLGFHHRENNGFSPISMIKTLR